MQTSTAIPVSGPIVLFDINGTAFDTSDAKRIQLGIELELPEGVELAKDTFACGEHHKRGTLCYDTRGMGHKINERIYKSAMQKLVSRADSKFKPKTGFPELARKLGELGWTIKFISRMYGLTEPIVESLLSRHGIPYDEIILTYGAPKTEHQLEATVVVDNELGELEAAAAAGKKTYLLLPGKNDTGFKVASEPKRVPPGLEVYRSVLMLGASLLAYEPEKALAA